MCYILVTDVILPLGQFSIDVTITDSDGAMISDMVASCDIRMVDSADNGCIDLKKGIVEPYLNQHEALISKRSKYVYLFQSMYATLLYVKEESNNDCGYSLFVDVIDIFFEHFGSNNTNLCESEYVLVCLIHMLYLSTV